MNGQKPASTTEQEEIGFTQSFVLARGFVQVDGFDALIGHDGKKRVFAQTDRRPGSPGGSSRGCLSANAQLHATWLDITGPANLLAGFTAAAEVL